MEESINSSFSSSLVCCDEEDDGASAFSDHESSWTTYFNDFMASEERTSSARGFSSVTGAVDWTSSAVSDATSCAAWAPKVVRSGESECYKRLRLRKKNKKKGRTLLVDDPLEDTASSPVNSPKVNDLSSADPQKKEERMEVVQQEEDVGRRIVSELERETGRGFDCIEGANECTELRRRGVCLVPMSMLVDYLG